jgi:lipoprotein NlpI
LATAFRLTFGHRGGGSISPRMKKVLFIVAAVLVLDVIASVALLLLAWHPIVRFGSNRLVWEGRRMVTLHQYNPAVALYSEAIKLDPGNAEAYVRRAYARTALKDYAGAVADCDQAIGLSPRYALAYARRGLAKEWNHDFPGALSDFDRAIELDPSWAFYYEERGWVRTNQNEPDGAIKDFDRAIEIDPKMAVAYYHRAYIERKRGDLTDADRDEDSAIDLAPKIAAYYVDRAQLRIMEDNLDAARSDADEAIQLQPTDARARYWRGIVLRRQGKMKDAIASFDQVLKLDPQYPGAMFERGAARYGDGDLQGAASDIGSSRLDAKDGPYAELWVWMISCEQGRKQEADRQLTAYLAAARKTKDGTWPEKLGDLLLGRITPEALATQIDPTRTDRQQKDDLCQNWYYAGKAALVRGDKAAARRCFTEAVATKAHEHLEFSEAQRELARL